MATSSDLLTVGNQLYEPFEEISRTLHLEDLSEIVRKGKLIGSSRGTYVARRFNGLWFKVVKDPNNQDFYGNIRFQINFDKLKNYYNNEWNCYFVEERSIIGRVLCTVLITKNSSLPEYKSIDIEEQGHPIWEREPGNYYHVVKKNSRTYAVEILIEGSSDDVTTWLFQNCERVAVNHSKANSKINDFRYEADICHRYNTMRCSNCPSSYTVSETTKKIKQNFPGFLSTSLNESDSSDLSTNSDDESDISLDLPTRSDEFGICSELEGVLKIYSTEDSD